MALWDKLFKKKDESPDRLNPIVQRTPPPPAPEPISSSLLPGDAVLAMDTQQDEDDGEQEAPK